MMGFRCGPRSWCLFLGQPWRVLGRPLSALLVGVLSASAWPFWVGRVDFGSALEELLLRLSKSGEEEVGAAGTPWMGEKGCRLRGISWGRFREACNVPLPGWTLTLAFCRSTVLGELLTSTSLPFRDNARNTPSRAH